MNEQMRSDEERKLISVNKSIAMILVVIIHSCALPETMQIIAVPLWLEKIKSLLAVGIGNAAVPSFFFISAYLLYKKEFTWYSNIKKKNKSLMIPYLIINTFWIAFFSLMQAIPFVSSYFSSRQYLVTGYMGLADAYTGLWERGVPIYYPFWFIRDLIILNVFSVIIRILVHKIPVLTAVICTIYCLLPWTLPIPAKSSIVFFVLGCYAAQYSVVWQERLRSGYKLVILCFFAWSVINTFIWSDNNTLLYYVRCTMGIGCLWGISDLVKNGRFGQAMVRMSDYVFAIYAFHEFYMAMLKKVAMSLIPQNDLIQLLEFLLIPVIIIIVCIFVSRIFERWLPSLYHVITGGRKTLEVIRKESEL